MKFIIWIIILFQSIITNELKLWRSSGETRGLGSLIKGYQTVCTGVIFNKVTYYQAGFLVPQYCLYHSNQTQFLIQDHFSQEIYKIGSIIVHPNYPIAILHFKYFKLGIWLLEIDNYNISSFRNFYITVIGWHYVKFTSKIYNQPRYLTYHCNPSENQAEIVIPYPKSCEFMLGSLLSYVNGYQHIVLGMKIMSCHPYHGISDEYLPIYKIKDWVYLQLGYELS